MLYFCKKEGSRMSKTYIFGHKKPDTDSVLSAIALSYLKNELGEETEARILGNINKETTFALNYFNLNVPKYLNDVKLQLKDINYHKGFFIHDTSSIYEGYQLMLKEGLTGLPVVDEENTFTGLITIKDLSHTIINENIEDLYTSYENLMLVLKGEAILKFDSDIIGKLIVAAYRSTTFIGNINLNQDMILIVGDRYRILDYAIESKVKLIILPFNSGINKELLGIVLLNMPLKKASN